MTAVLFMVGGDGSDSSIVSYRMMKAEKELKKMTLDA